MPTLLTHPAVPLALALGLGRHRIPRALLAAGLLLSILPDLDVLAFRLGIPYAAALGHRGFSHALAAALGLGLLTALLLRPLGIPWPRAALYLSACAASHALLDACTNGGLGVALLAPWSSTRHFSPWRPIEVAPLSLARFISWRGVAVLASELRWVWLPAGLLALGGIALRRLGPR